MPMHGNYNMRQMSSFALIIKTLRWELKHNDFNICHNYRRKFWNRLLREWLNIWNTINQ